MFKIFKSCKYLIDVIVVIVSYNDHIDPPHNDKVLSRPEDVNDSRVLVGDSDTSSDSNRDSVTPDLDFGMPSCDDDSMETPNGPPETSDEGKRIQLIKSIQLEADDPERELQ